MRKLLLLYLTIIISGSLHAQLIAVKNNLLYDFTATPNLGVEVGISKHLTFDLTGRFHPWSLQDRKTLKHWQIQPELRYWFSERFDEHFIGLHAQYMDYNFYGFKLPWGMEKRFGYDGTSYSAGLSYGYQLYISPRWNIEFTIGVGYSRFDYTKYEYDAIFDKYDIGLFNRDYYGLTKLGISFVYLIK